MSDRTKLLLACLPFFLIGAGALLLPKIRAWEAARELKEVESAPLKSVISRSGEAITSTRHTYSVGDYGVTEIGNIRLAFEGLPFGGNSVSSITLATDAGSTGGGGSSGTGNRRFEITGIPNGTECKFGGVTFEIVDAKLRIGEETIDATGPPTLILIGADRKVLDVRPLNVPANEVAERSGTSQSFPAHDSGA